MTLNQTRFDFSDPRRPQTQHFSNADKEDCFFVMLAEKIDDDLQSQMDMCKRMYKTFKEN